ncbi:MAG: radical SAM protein [Planctomycetes bacterium]|nr:radical SAM protein [Planctomycetota bacterium]
MIRRIHEKIVYGPVQSRRFGPSLGINLTGNHKFCSFNCLYCFRGFNEGGLESKEYLEGLPSSDSVSEEIAAWLESHDSSEIRNWTFAGNGEPTDHPEFSWIVARIVSLRDRCHPDVKITVLTNGMGLIPRVQPKHMEVWAALEMTDRICLKLDAGTPDTWQKLARPFKNVSLSEWLFWIEQVKDPMIQTMLVQGGIDNTQSRELDGLRACYRRLKPKEIHFLTMNKASSAAGLKPVSYEKLRAIQKFVCDELYSGKAGISGDQGSKKHPSMPQEPRDEGTPHDS